LSVSVTFICFLRTELDNPVPKSWINSLFWNFFKILFYVKYSLYF
jgi:hypothetical protein